MKRILYADSDVSRPAAAAFAEGLRVLGEVCLMESLSQEIVATVRQALDDRPFDAIVSHLPQSRGLYRVPSTSFRAISELLFKTEGYGPAFNLLGRIKLMADIPIVVYTGAHIDDVPSVSWELSGVDGLHKKSDNPATDGQRVVRMIRDAWASYAALPPAAEPRCESNTSAVWIETVVRLNLGLSIYAASKIAHLLRDVEGVVECLNADGSVARESCANDITDIICLEATCGSRLRIRVNSGEQRAKTALCRVHQLLNRRYLEHEGGSGIG